MMILDVLAASELEDLCERVVAELSSSVDGGVAVLLADTSGKQLEVAAAAGLPSWFDDVSLPTGCESGLIGRVVADVRTWNQDDWPDPEFLTGVDVPLAAVSPIALPGGTVAHGAIVVTGESVAGLDRIAIAAALIALHIEADFDGRFPTLDSTEPTTGLPDRAQLLSWIERCRGEAHHDVMSAVFSIRVDPGMYRTMPDADLDQADLVRIGAVLQQCVRDQDAVAHLGGQDFAVVALDLGSDRQVANYGIRIVEAVAGTAAGSDHPVGVYEATVGGALIDAVTDGAATLREATKARDESLDRFGLARSDDASISAASTDFEGDVLLAALRDGEIQPWYQPVFDLETVTTVAVEALARWVRPDGTLISPGDFLPALHEHHLMSRLTSTILRAVIRDLSVWHADGLVGDDFSASVNITMSDITGGMLPAVVSSLIDEYQLDPRYLSLELTETEAMEDVNFSLATLHQLHDLGVGLSIDDFGTGYSSLSYLSQLPVDLVKIDRAFVAGLEDRRGDEAIISAVVDVASAVGLKVLAEGIETEAQLRHLTDLGVDLGQGFLISPALPPEKLLEHLHVHPATL